VFIRPKGSRRLGPFSLPNGSVPQLRMLLEVLHDQGIHDVRAIQFDPVEEAAPECARAPSFLVQSLAHRVEDEGKQSCSTPVTNQPDHILAEKITEIVVNVRVSRQPAVAEQVVVELCRPEVDSPGRYGRA
jgi:hypothetical protein